MAKQRTIAGTEKDEFDSIRSDYGLGRRLAELFPDRFPYGEAKQIGDAVGRPDLSRDKAEKLRALARAYPPEAFARLLEKCRRGGYVPGITILTRLASLKTKDRRSVEPKMIAGAWSKSQLNAEIRSRKGSRSKGGRKRQLPSDPKKVLTELERECESWIRLQALLQDSDLDSSVLKRLRETGAAVMRLKREIEAKREGGEARGRAPRKARISEGGGGKATGFPTASGSRARRAVARRSRRR